jgi:hypothetical protein
MPPRLNRKRALFVLTKIDEILAWETQKEAERDTRFVDLGRYLCEVRAGQYWRLGNLKSFDEFLARRFPDSRRTAYYLMSIHEHLPPQIRRELKQVGWTKAAELTKVARSDGKDFDCAAWMHKARSLPRDQFKREVDQHLTGTDNSRGYCLEMICADFLAGAHLDNGDPEILLNSISRYYKFLPGEQQQAFLENLSQKAS